MISEFPLLVFTTLAGLTAGSYTMSAIFPVGQEGKRAWLFPLVCGLLLAAGLVGLPMHLEHPERMLIALSNPGAMIAQEAYWSIGFGVILAADFIVSKVKGKSPRALRVVGAVAGLGLMCVMANAYFVSNAVAPWAAWQTFPLFIVGDLAMGAALCGLMEKPLFEKGSFFGAAVALDALFAVAAGLEAAYFAGLGLDVVPFIVALVVAAVGGIAGTVLARRGKPTATSMATLAFACVLVGVVIARYAFYAAGSM
ncbi:DmsC/YnfH family molybdoenzyme membrane anchor subunit [Gordonibacter massiliensis (ex Traore et al. 2017)]|uniref:DmsC/YnfH family molybdoenzyme membrane anchor subunit n=1 Tax=Gordonibacter massiliensis (ex Traore et al. 2017) TaxID=1841863 RepID=UPI001FEC3829|nr:DmsC/YnfH family molybdoenzyme membrane anchor subunit [Gordonibacter massiliensis (ex Traore et al. 2017)]